MRIYNELILKIGKNRIKVDFGIPDINEEVRQMFKLRFKVYAEKGYINPSRYSEEIEKDEYDEPDKTTYFIAKINGDLIGTARLIKTIPLPTELYFKFKEPELMKKISQERRAEIGRLIVIPYRVSDKYLPRHIITLFLFKSMLDYAIEQGYQGGYAFIKFKLFKKLNKLKVPFHVVENYILEYPKKGVLYNYFYDEEDPVIPIYYLTNEVQKYFTKLLNNWLLFKKLDKNKFLLNSLIYILYLKISQIFFKN